MATITKFEDLFSNLIGWWKLDDDAANSDVYESVNGVNNVMSLSGTGAINTDTVSVSGKINKAIDFGPNGTIRYVDIGDLSVGNTVKMRSTAAWIKLSGTANTRTIFDTGFDGLANSPDDKFYVAGGSNDLTAGIRFTGTKVFYIDGKITTTVPDDKAWHFVAMTCSAGILPRDAHLSSSSGQKEMEGVMDNIMIFDRVLTAYEISNLYLEREFLEYEIGESRIGSSHLAVIQDLNKIDRPYTLVCSYTSDLLNINLNYSKQAVLGGVPLSISLINSNQSDPSLSINNMYYVFNIIENDEQLVSEANTFTDPANTTFSFDGTRLSAVKKNNNRYYIEIAKKDINISNSSIGNSVTLAGVEMPLGESNELIMYNTGLTMSDIQGLVNIMIGGVPLTAGRVGNEYYLIVSPIENIS